MNIVKKNLFHFGYYSGIITYLQVKNTNFKEEDFIKEIRTFNNLLPVPEPHVEDWINHFFPKKNG